MNDLGYKSVLKEYDFYHSNDNDFEIIEEYSNNYINTPNDNDNNNNSIKNNLEIKNQNEKLQNYIIKILKIILNSRNNSYTFSSNSKRQLKDNKNNNFFPIDIEEIIEYDNLKAWDNSDGDKKKKYIIDFYLIKNNNENDKDSLKSAKINEKQKLLVERWKIKYKEKFNFKKDIKNLDLFLDKKMKIIEKNIITYSRILPLYNISKDDNYSIDFKFNPNIKRGKKSFIDEKSTEKIKIINNDLYSFKLSINYLKIKPENIDLFFNKNNYDFVIIPSNKSRKRFLSDNDTNTNYKKSSQNILNNIEHNNEEKYNKNNGNQKPSFIIENYINDRRLSYDNTKPIEDEKEKKLDKNKYLSNENSENDYSLVITETNSDSGHNSNKNQIKNEKKNSNENNIRKMTYDYYNNENNQKEYIPRKTQTLKNHNFIKEEIDNLHNLDFKGNCKIKKIVQEYKTLRKMIKILPKYDNIKYNKLSTFIFST